VKHLLVPGNSTAWQCAVLHMSVAECYHFTCYYHHHVPLCQQQLEGSTNGSKSGSGSDSANGNGNNNLWVCVCVCNREEDINSDLQTDDATQLQYRFMIYQRVM